MTDDDIRSQERVGSVLNDKWTLERLLGVGGMAAVYAARHRNGARAAVKMMHPDLSRHREVCERFRREGYAANRVEHPGVVKVLDDDVVVGGDDAGTAYLVMELLEGESLQTRLERGPPMGEREFLEIAEEVLDVLEVAHARSVVHRDLKPENLFLVRDDGDPVGARPRVKVLDFGLARLLDGQTITTYGLALGTPSFMSPEQAAGRIDEIDGRTDLFSLAATGFRLRTGRRIHEGANAIELVRKMASMAAPRVRSLAPDASAAYARVVDRALEFRREDRYASAAAMREDVHSAIAEIDGNARTQLAIPAPTANLVTAEPTFNVSERDFEPSDSAAAPPEPKTQMKGLGVQESIHLPMRRSFLPWIAALLLAGAGAKLWLGRPVASEHHDIAPVASAPSSSHDAGTDASPPALVAAPAGSSAPHPSASSTAPRAQSPAPAPAPHPRTPAKVGPGNVRKLKANHHPGPTGTSQKPL